MKVAISNIILQLQTENPGGEMLFMSHGLLPSGPADGCSYLLSLAFSGSTAPTLVCMRPPGELVKSQTSGLHSKRLWSAFLISCQWVLRPIPASDLASREPVI